MLTEFLKRDGVSTEEDAIRWSVNAAVQRNRVYRSYEGRDEFLAEWTRMIREESKRYRSDQPISDNEHCGIIGKISDDLSDAFGSLLNNGRLRFGTSQKAFNLYLKYLWAFGEIKAPPHCPVDRIVLQALGIDEAWTQCDDQDQYMSWIDAIRSDIRNKSGNMSVAEWENEAWLQARRSRPPSSGHG